MLIVFVVLVRILIGFEAFLKTPFDFDFFKVINYDNEESK